jgi:3-oxoadipate enol-lactonase
METRHGYIEVEGASLYHEDAGAGAPVVLLHGFSLDTRTWDGQFDTLAQRHRVVRYDLRGFGRSSLPGGRPYSHVGDLRELLDCLRIERPILVGISMGGGLAIDFALTYLDAVRALVLVDSTLGGYRWTEEESNLYRAVVGTAQRMGVEPARQLWLRDPMFAKTMMRPDLTSRFTQMVEDYSGWHWLNEDPQKHLDPPALKRLGEVAVPALVVVGELDVLDMRGIAAALEQGIPSARKVVIPGAGHLSSMEAPEALNRLLLEFLAKLA